MKKIFTAALAFTIGTLCIAVASTIPRQDYTSDVSTQIRKRSLSFMQAGSQDLGWRFTQAGGVAKDLTDAQVIFYYKDGTNWSVTATGTLENATNGQVLVSFTPAQLNTNGGPYSFILTATSSEGTLAWTYGDLMLITNILAGAGAAPLSIGGTNVNYALVSNYLNVATDGPYLPGSNVTFRSAGNGAQYIDVGDVLLGGITATVASNTTRSIANSATGSLNTAAIAVLNTTNAAQEVSITANSAGVASNVAGVAGVLATATSNTSGLVDADLGIASNVLNLAGLTITNLANRLGVASNVAGLIDADLGIASNVTASAAANAGVASNVLNLAGLTITNLANRLGVASNVAGLIDADLGIASNVAGLIDADLGIASNVLGIVAADLGIASNVNNLAGLTITNLANRFGVASNVAGLVDADLGIASNVVRSIANSATGAAHTISIATIQGNTNKYALKAADFTQFTALGGTSNQVFISHGDGEGRWVAQSGGGGSGDQTPITSNVEVAGFTFTNGGSLYFTNGTFAGDVTSWTTNLLDLAVLNQTRSLANSSTGATHTVQLTTLEGNTNSYVRTNDTRALPLTGATLLIDDASLTNEPPTYQQVIKLVTEASEVSLYGTTDTSVTNITGGVGAALVATQPSTQQIVTNAALGAGATAVGTFWTTNLVSGRRGTYRLYWWTEKTTGTRVMTGCARMVTSNAVDGVVTQAESSCSTKITGVLDYKNVSADITANFTNSAFGVEYYLTGEGLGSSATVLTYLGFPYDSHISTPGLGANIDLGTRGATGIVAGASDSYNATTRVLTYTTTNNLTRDGKAVMTGDIQLGSNDIHGASSVNAVTGAFDIIVMGGTSATNFLDVRASATIATNAGSTGQILYQSADGSNYWGAASAGGGGDVYTTSNNVFVGGTTQAFDVVHATNVVVNGTNVMTEISSHYDALSAGIASNVSGLVDADLGIASNVSAITLLDIDAVVGVDPTLTASIEASGTFVAIKGKTSTDGTFYQGGDGAGGATLALLPEAGATPGNAWLSAGTDAGTVALFIGTTNALEVNRDGDTDLQEHSLLDAGHVRVGTNGAANPTSLLLIEYPTLDTTRTISCMTRGELELFYVTAAGNMAVGGAMAAGGVVSGNSANFGSGVCDAGSYDVSGSGATPSGLGLNIQFDSSSTPNFDNYLSSYDAEIAFMVTRTGKVVRCFSAYTNGAAQVNASSYVSPDVAFQVNSPQGQTDRDTAIRVNGRLAGESSVVFATNKVDTAKIGSWTDGNLHGRADSSAFSAADPFIVNSQGVVAPKYYFTGLSTNTYIMANSSNFVFVMNGTNIYLAP